MPGPFITLLIVRALFNTPSALGAGRIVFAAFVRIGATRAELRLNTRLPENAAVDPGRVRVEVLESGRICRCEWNVWSGNKKPHEYQKPCQRKYRDESTHVFFSFCEVETGR